jgi:hypothetical protein
MDGRVTFRPDPAALLLALALAGCTTTVHSAPPGLANAVVARSLPTRGWELWEETRRAGSVVRYDEEGRAARAWFSVRNPHGQELGMVDADGRAWRYKPHQREPVWLGTGTVLQGACRILGAGPTASLVEVPLADLAARGG